VQAAHKILVVGGRSEPTGRRTDGVLTLKLSASRSCSLHTSETAYATPLGNRGRPSADLGTALPCVSCRWHFAHPIYAVAQGRLYVLGGIGLILFVFDRTRLSHMLEIHGWGFFGAYMWIKRRYKESENLTSLKL
jgi:hypothetical protein